MAEDRLDAKDLKTILLWILLGLAGASVAYKYFFVAFPEAAVDFRVSRAEALGVARNFVVAQGHELDGYQSSIVFRVDDDAKTYLEREVGLEQANRLMSSTVSVWYWDVRFFRPRQQEEFKARVSPAGRVVGSQHIIEEAREGARLEQDAARRAAEEFLRTRYRADLAAYDFLLEEANSIERPRRRDWSFAWERRGFKAPATANGAPYRLRVTLQGADMGSSGEFLKVPEAWKRDYERLRSSNLFYQYVAQVPFAFLYGAVFLVLFELGRRGLLRWSGALRLGLLVAVLFFVKDANEWPLTRAGYDTNSSYAAFFAGQMAQSVLFSVLAGLGVAVAGAAGEPLYRRNQPNQLRLGAAFRLAGLRSKEFFRSSVIGAAMAAAHIGFVVLFYVVGKRFGFWAPQDINYTDVVSTALPWIYPLTISVYAATNEEFLFRLFAIPLLLRHTRSRFLAVVVPALVWGFLHSAYPQEPGYVRGIEVGLIGIVAGVVMLRYGIVATLVWHYTVDALLISLFLLRSESLYFRVSGGIVAAAVLIPLVLAGASYLVRRRFAADETLLNRAMPLVETAAPPVLPVAVEPSRTGYQGLAPRTLGIVLGSGLLGALLLAAVKPETIGDFVRFRVNARQAAVKADEVLLQRLGTKFNPVTWRRATTVVETFNSLGDSEKQKYNGYVSEYLRRQVGTAGANRIYQEKVPSAFWRVRYFRDSQKEEYSVFLNADGSLHSVHHPLDEKAPGASLTKEEAQARAESYLRDEKKLDLNRWKLVEASSDKRPARTDHTLVWEELAAVGEAHVRVEIKVQGDEVSGYRTFVKIPEEWERRQKEETLASTIHTIGRIGLIAALSITVLVIFFKNLKQQRVPWARLTRWALWGLLASVATTVSSLPVLLARYPTEFPFKTYLAILVITVFLLVTVAYSALFFLLGLAWFFVLRAFGAERMPSWLGMPATYYRDAFLVAVAGAGVLLGLGRLPFLLARVWPTAQRALEASLPAGLDSYLPAAYAVGGAVWRGLFLAGLVGLLAGFLASYARQRWIQFGFVLLLAVTRVGNWGSPADFAKMVLLQLVILGVIWSGITRVVRFNLLAYFLLAATTALAGAAANLLSQPNGFFRANGFAVVVALVVLLAWPLLAWLRGRLPGALGTAQATSGSPPA